MRPPKRLSELPERLRSTLFCFLACLLIAGLAYFISTRLQTLEQERAQLRLWRDVEVTTERLLAVLTQAESSQRGYLLTHRSEYLEAENASARASELIASLEKSTARTPEYPIVQRIATLARQKLAELAETTALSRRGDQSRALSVVNSNRGKALMDEIRTLADDLGATAGRENTQFKALVDDIEGELRLDVWMTSALSILLLIALTYVLRRDARRIRNTAEELAITLHSIGDAVVTTDAQGYVTYLNPIALELGQQELPAKPRRFVELFKLINEQSGEQAPDPIVTVLRDGKTIGLANHTALLRPDGSTIAIEDSAAPMLDEGGKVRGVVFVFKDISERRRAEAALERAAVERERSVAELKAADEELKVALRRKDEFLATLAHELRNPLAPIRSAIKLLENEELSIEQKRWGRAVIARQTEHMARLMDDLLDAARIHRGEISLQIERVDLRSIVTEALDVAMPLIERKGHHFELRLPAQPVTMMADHVRLSQVLSNLLTNAAKYTDPGGRITLSARVEDDRLLISVKDTGVGVAADAIPSLFEMFGQIKTSLDRSEGGLGIGLSLANQLILLHGGRLSVESPGEGQGSEFMVELPGAVIEREVSDAEIETVEARAINAARLILIVDDNADAATTLGMLLELSGNDVLIARSGPQALELMQQHSPSVVILDIGLPGMDGYQVARALRARPQGNGLLLIALTGWGDADDKKRAIEAGFDYHFAKPVGMEELEAVISSHGESTAIKNNSTESLS
jgi:PAS domain S-box-containing protein